MFLFSHVSRSTLVMLINQQIFVKFRIFLHKHAPWINQNLSKFYEIVSKINYKFRLIVGLYSRKSDFSPCEQQIQSLACVFWYLIGFFVFKSKFHFSSRAGWLEPRLFSYSTVRLILATRPKYKQMTVIAKPRKSLF